MRMHRLGRSGFNGPLSEQSVHYYYYYYLVLGVEFSDGKRVLCQPLIRFMVCAEDNEMDNGLTGSHISKLTDGECVSCFLA